MTDFKQFNLEKKEELDPLVSPFELSAPNINRTDKDLNVKNKFCVNDNETLIAHGQRKGVFEVVSGATNTYTAQRNNYIIGIKDVTISRGVQLPGAALAGVGKVYVIKDMSGSATSTTITIAAIEGELLDGEVTQSIIANWGIKKVFADGANWFTW